MDSVPKLTTVTVHHTVVLVPSTRPGIQHINHQVDDIDDVMQSYYWLKQQGGKSSTVQGGIRSQQR
jgi:2,3-dihydroxy-p-cumate/2,3-dihydroxybenzoate 3,4-dioxygenase